MRNYCLPIPQQLHPPAFILLMSQHPHPDFPLPSLPGLHIAPCCGEDSPCFMACDIPPLCMPQQAQPPPGMFLCWEEVPAATGVCRMSGLDSAPAQPDRTEAASNAGINGGSESNLILKSWYL